MERNRIDLSKLERDDLRDLLSMARDEWEKYIPFRQDVELCEKSIAEEEEKREKAHKQAKGFIVIMIILFPAAIFILPNFLLYRSIEKKAQKKIKEYESQLLVLQQKEMEAMSKFDKVWDIPDDYCYEYAFTKILKDIDNFKAHNWKEVTTLYDRHIHEHTMEYNARISAEEAMKQTDISRQTRNAARAAAAGAWVSAIRR